MSAWHSKTAAQVLDQLDTSRDRGLAGAEAEERLGRYGPNVLEERKRPGLVVRFLAQLKDPMILVLLGAAGLSLWAGGGEDWVDAVIILVIVLVNACISIAQENSAEKALEALRRMSAPMARVVRDGTERRELDLSAGDGWYISAGGREEISWSKGGVEDPLTLTDSSGDPLTVNAGKTYICITDGSYESQVTFTGTADGA